MIPVGTGSVTRPGAGGDHTGRAYGESEEGKAMGKQILNQASSEAHAHIAAEH